MVISLYIHNMLTWLLWLFIVLIYYASSLSALKIRVAHSQDFLTSGPPAPPPCGAITPWMMSEVSTDSCVCAAKALGWFHFLPWPPRLPAPSLIMEFPMTSCLLALARYIHTHHRYFPGFSLFFSCGHIFPSLPAWLVATLTEYSIVYSSFPILTSQVF